MFCGGVVLYWLQTRISWLSLSSLLPRKEYSCGYRSYPDPKHGQGLPFLAEVFATDDGKYVQFVAMNKGGCLKEWQGEHEFHSTLKHEHHFVCGFPDGRLVRSDPVHRKWPTDLEWTNAIIMIRCPLPAKYQTWVKEPRPTTHLTVSLYPDVDFFSVMSRVSKARSFQNIPVCHGEWPANKVAVLPRASSPNKNYLSMMTKIKPTYRVFDGGMNRETVTIEPKSIIAWIEYHHAIGFEHFYIYDNEAHPHGMLEQLLMSYIDSGLVTYVWYPLQDCIVDYQTKQKQVGDGFTIGQATSASAALQRYRHRTTYMAHFDVDEYIVLPEGIDDLKTLIRENEQYDSLQLPLTWFSECTDGEEPKDNTSLPFDRAHCFVSDVTPPKSIMKTSRILAFFVHKPFVTVEGKDAGNSTNMENILVAHYRSKRARDVSLNVQFSNRTNCMDHWSAHIHERVDAYFRQNKQHLEESGRARGKRPA